MSRLRRSFLTVACAITVLGLSSPADAQSVEFWSGALCQPRSASSAVQYTQYGFVNNGTAGPIQAECPFPMTRQGECLYRFSSVQVKVYDRHPTLNVTCTLRAINSDGSVLAGGQFTRSSTGNSAGVQVLSFPTLTGQLPLASLLHMSCSVPPKVNNNPSAITFYHLNSTC
jgi:hypothetical protein